ncbi:hypothetical protein [Palleronia sp.]|uniref:hypothetical protein n=1 Tax=Palleronia sp. TaxID=1940284 RepID=UPI0035C847DE
MPLHMTTIEDVDRYELATILAALRLLQQTPALPPEIEEIATEEGDFERIDDEKIDALCERINAVCEYPWRDVTEGDAETVALEARVAGLFEGSV